jgi:uncharacterized membrane protein
MKLSRTIILAYSAMGIALNVILGTAVSSMKIPLLFLDTIGTVLISVLFGPWWGVLTGGLTNVVLGATTGAGAIFFALVNIVIALVVGFIARRFDYTKWYVALATGIVILLVSHCILNQNTVIENHETQYLKLQPQILTYSYTLPPRIMNDLFLELYQQYIRDFHFSNFLY